MTAAHSAIASDRSCFPLDFSRCLFLDCLCVARTHTHTHTHTHTLTSKHQPRVAGTARFASIAAASGASQADAVLVTRALSFTRGRYFFVNADHADMIKMSLLDADTMAELAGLGEDDYLGPSGGSTSGELLEVAWKGGADAIAKAAGTRVRLRFRFDGTEAR